MSLNRYVRQLNPIKENKVNYVDKYKKVYDKNFLKRVRFMVFISNT